ncbi:hypothetical protein BB560_006078 [Smittium megazygosporum]|uniref:Rad60/SUMO-like domain-containing protein n=1 Tax=Smittium megazygosporum TaxID=133381 RepID=A0A2T9YIG1_9FUNG|nr:hypothetical protein BB560_006078 [Smittium megazygosporum]
MAIGIDSDSSADDLKKNVSNFSKGSLSTVSPTGDNEINTTSSANLNKIIKPKLLKKKIQAVFESNQVNYLTKKDSSSSLDYDSSSSDDFFSRKISKGQQELIFKTFSNDKKPNLSLNDQNQDLDSEQGSLSESEIQQSKIVNTKFERQVQNENISKEKFESQVSSTQKPGSSEYAPAVSTSQFIELSEDSDEFVESDDPDDPDYIDPAFDENQSTQDPYILTKKPRKTYLSQSMKIPSSRKPESEIENKPDLSEYSELDPALLEVLSTHKPNIKSGIADSRSSILSNTLDSAIDLEEEDHDIVKLIFKLKTDQILLNEEIQKYSDLIWKNIRCNTASNFTKASNSNLEINVSSDIPLFSAFEKLKKNNLINYDISRFIMVYDGVKIYTSVTPSAINPNKKIVLDVYPKEVHNRYLSYKKDLEESLTVFDTLRSDKQSDFRMVDSTTDINQIDNFNQSASEMIKIKIRNKLGEDKFIKIAKETKVKRIIEMYCEMSKITFTPKVFLYFDDEKLDPEISIGETEIEDEDMVTVSY